MRPIILRDKRISTPEEASKTADSHTLASDQKSFSADEESKIADELDPMDKPTRSTAVNAGKLMSLEEAVRRVPDSLKSEMKELLRADFREVRRLARDRNN